MSELETMYVKSHNSFERQIVLIKAKENLLYGDMLQFYDYCIAFLENRPCDAIKRLGLSGVQNEDNL